MKIEEKNRINGTDDVKKMLPVSEVLKEKEWGEVQHSQVNGHAF